MANAPVTFLGPIGNFGAKKGKRSCGFLMLQSAGGELLKLEYPDRPSAREARNTLLKMDWSFPVPKANLLYGIEKGLKHAHEKGKSGRRPAERPPVPRSR